MTATRPPPRWGLVAGLAEQAARRARSEQELGRVLGIAAPHPVRLRGCHLDVSHPAAESSAARSTTW
ncbi:hypothetical protein ACWCPS_02665 [Streptomyces mauvecolor]